MKENILFAIAGVVLGFIIGFFIANSIGVNGDQPTTDSAQTSDTQPAAGRLPPNHPDISEQGTSAASTSAQAQTAMDEADRKPQDFVAQIRAAAIFYELSAYDKATLYLNRALALKPNDPDALTGLGHTRYDTGDYVGAAKYYEKVLAQRPDDADIRTDFGNTFFRRTPPDYSRAIVEYRKALESDPKNEQALEKLAAAAIRKGDKTTARQAIDKLTTLNPSNSAIPTLRSEL
ncbi:MAG: hypothetical protein QOJ64_1851 [Acidobacteriota bacterium]|jgi:tetratricopeptide (TPR) repeat protein|nr:hypothetical protein [Acidobacteriota bacterium]